MRKLFSVVAVSVLSTSALACPYLSGTWQCPADPSVPGSVPVVLTVSQQTDQYGTTTYTSQQSSDEITGPQQGAQQVIVADGVLRPEPSVSAYAPYAAASMTASCDGNNTLRGVLSGFDPMDGQFTVVSDVYLDNGNYTVVTQYSSTAHGASNKQQVCTPAGDNNSQGPAN